MNQTYIRHDNINLLVNLWFLHLIELVNWIRKVIFDMHTKPPHEKHKLF